jgi:hypothetical protein
MYFSNFPKIVYNNIVLTDIVTRIKVHDSWLNNPTLYYEYNFQDHDTAESIASKLYGDTFLYWIVLLFNNIFDPFFELPLSYDNFNTYINDKYLSLGEAMVPSRNGIEYSQITIDPIYGYQKVVRMRDYYDDQVVLSEEYFVVDQHSYATLYESDNPFNTTVNLADGSIIIYEAYRRWPQVTIYEKEFEDNEAKRKILLLRPELWPQAKQELINLLHQY